MIAELTAGDVDLSAYVTESDVKKVKDDARTALVEATSTSAIYLAINMKKKPFDDFKMRQALAHAVDAEAVRKAAMSGRGLSPLYALFPDRHGVLAGSGGGREAAGEV